MAIESSDIIICPNCKKKYRLEKNLVNRKVKCTCGASLRIYSEDGKLQAQLIAAKNNNQPKPSNNKKPSAKAEKETQTYELDENPEDETSLGNSARREVAPPQEPQKKIISNDEDLYELEIPDDNDKQHSISSDANPKSSPQDKSTSLPDDAIGADPLDENQPEEPAYVNAAVAAARREEDRKKWANELAEQEHRKVNYIWPTAMLIIGSIVILITAFVIQLVSGKSGLLALAVIGALEILIMTPLLLVSLFIAASVLKLGFGDIRLALYKAIAINTGPGALADIISIPLVVLASVGFLSMMLAPFIIYLVLIGLPLSKMFDLDIQETSITIVFIIALRLAAFLLIFMNVYNLLFSTTH